ncbi:MAG TPA: hypothetical protein PL192_06945 [Polynucleobacter sp.]|jgi:hypothetical protein|nr:hypothetical protein [Polynucleobacter sp.]
MTDSIEIHNEPLLGIEVSQSQALSLEISASPATSLEMNLALSGPRGEKGETGPPVDLTPILGNAETDLALLYAINKL